MGRDQVVTTLDPAPLNAFIYGLGWNTVLQRGSRPWASPDG